MNRLPFNIPDDGSTESMVNTITMDQIMKSVVVEVNEFLKDYLQPISTGKIKKITDYVTYCAPQFRHLLKYMPEAITKIKPNLSEDRLDDELHRIKREFDRSTNMENAKLLDDLNKGILSANEYVERFGEQIEKINSANGAALAEYIAHRKIILDLMDFGIRKDDDKFQKESFLHNIIYPMRTTSADTPYSNHNLWLLDEKLAYCSYISSDIPFDNNPKDDRTDIMILDSPVAVSDEENIGREYESIVLFEFKRPMRDDYNDGDNPINQLYGYVKQLQTNKKKDKDGRIIRVGQNTKFFLYAVCDITSTLERILDYHDFSQTPDKLGYTDSAITLYEKSLRNGYNTEEDVTIVTSYDKSYFKATIGNISGTHGPWGEDLTDITRCIIAMFTENYDDIDLCKHLYGEDNKHPSSKSWTVTNDGYKTELSYGGYSIIITCTYTQGAHARYTELVIEAEK